MTHVSIVLATDRNSPFLAESLRGALAQTHEDWDLLVVDNGAPDHAALAAHLDDRRMSIIRIDPDSTLGLSRNIGVGLVTGELLTFLDDDDVWAPNRLERHVQWHAEHPDTLASYSAYWHMDARGERFGKDWRSPGGSSSELLAGRINTPLGPTLVVRHDAFHLVGGFSPEIPILEDFEFALRLAQRGDLVYIDDLLLGYRRHDANMTSTAPANVRLRRRVMDAMIDRQRWSAAGRGDTATERLLAERLRRYRSQQAHEVGDSVPRALRAGQIRSLVPEVGWAVRRAPFAFARGAADAARRVIRRR